MGVVVTVLHVIVCFFLIAVVLLQRGKGAQVGAVFGGGGGATMFGGRGAGNFLTKLTTGAAVVFMLTSLSLAYMRMHRGEQLFEGGAIEEEGARPQALPFEEVGKAPGEAPAEQQAAPPADAPAPNPAP
jgi:preprotein translocase subunit SecG